MRIRIQKLVKSSCLIALLMVSTVIGVNAETASDENSLENRLKEFNAPDTVNAASKPRLKAVKKRKTKVAKAKTKAKKRRRNKRACYQSSVNTLLDRAEYFQPAIRNSSYRYGVSEALIIAVITAESCFYQHARSPKNAKGLMQLIPATAKRFGVKNAYVASQNIKGGTRYLKFLLERFSGNLHLAIAAYNAGEGAVDRFSGIPPYRETKEYVRRVMSVYRKIQKATGSVTIISQSKPNQNKAGVNAKLQKTSSSAVRGSFIKPDYNWVRKQGAPRVKAQYPIKNTQKRRICKDVSSQKLLTSSWLVSRGDTMKRYYVSKKPQSLSSISKRTGVSLNLLLRMNKNVSRYMIKPGNKVLVWQCTNR